MSGRQHSTGFGGCRWVRAGGLVVALWALPATPGAAQQGGEAALPTLAADDYARFERLGAFELDPSGRWLVAAVTRVDGDGELRVHRADGSAEPLLLAHGTRPEFSSDGRWLAYRKGVAQAERENAEGPVHDRLGLVDLSALSDTVLFEISGFAFRDDGRQLAARGVAASDSTGADLLVFDPATVFGPADGGRTMVGNVDAFAWQDDGSLLAATLKTQWGTTNGVVLFDPESSTLRTLDSGDAEYVGLTWWEDSQQLAVMRSLESDDREEVSHDVLVWPDVRSGAPRVLAATGGRVAPDVRVTPYRGITFSADGRSIFFGVRPWEHKAVEPDGVGADGDAAADSTREGAGNDAEGESEENDDQVGPADVQVWHWDDDLILRAQEYRATQIARQNHLAVWHLDDDAFLVLGDDLEEPVTLADGGRWGLVADVDPYRFERRFGAGTADWYRVDSRTGERRLLGEGLRFGVVSDMKSATALIYDANAWHAVDLASLDRTTLAAGRSFTQPLDAYDYPGPRPSWGFGGWVEGGSSALVYDEFDVHLADLTTGETRRLTDGEAEARRYRVVNLDPDASFFQPARIEAGDPVWYSVIDTQSKASGYARGELDGSAETLVLEDARVASLGITEGGERAAFRMERWDDSPDVFVADGDLDDRVQVTDTNPFQSDFAWGRAELLDYTTDAGHDLQAILVYPADFDDGQQYPLILYQYERLSDGLHGYHVASERDYYDFQAWSQEGYFVLMPDIVYEPGRPGPSALDAVQHALDAALATGHVDPDAMGLIGHSWGGYQATYLPTRTDRFAASVAGAAITNFMSFMGAVHWNGGLPETGHWETGQARMAVPYWEDMEGHLESSPAHFIADLETPMLLMHGDDDGVVDFYQGLEFYNYARRAGKEVVLLVYPGADHGLSDEAQQVDYHRRILEWFGHYLKGEPAAGWITEGESWVERDERLKG
ncbi:MAG: S9 family peptidase [Gemmatimonadetes bacterium]|nr:S9 family peptidase [Gemmatimonadota bacterium]